MSQPNLPKEIKFSLQRQITDKKLSLSAFTFKSVDSGTYSIQVKGKKFVFKVKQAPSNNSQYIITRNSIYNLKEEVYSCTAGEMYKAFTSWLASMYYEINLRLYEEDNHHQQFNPILSTISPDFIATFHQCQIAEANKLDLIAGMGYRRALEFLVKDYLLYKSILTQQDVEKIALGNAVHKLPNSLASQISSLAVKLGNDMSHFHRKLTNKGIDDLKANLILIASQIALDEEYEINKGKIDKEAEGILNSW